MGARSRKRWARTAVTVCVVIACSLLALPSSGRAQGDWDDIPTLYGGGLKVDLGEQEDDMYIRFLLWAQVWLRATQMSPGSVVDGSTTQSGRQA